MILGIAVLAGLAIWSVVNLIRRTGDTSKRPIDGEILNSDDLPQ
jgi:hypothetical protein